LALPALAELRAASNIEATVIGERLWLRWDGADERIVNCLRPVSGAEFFSLRDGIWHRIGCRVPYFGEPQEAAWHPLHYWIVPEPTRPVPAEESAIRPVALRLVEDHRPRSTSALRCRLNILGQWAESATSRQIGSLRAAICEGEIIVCGSQLPLLRDSQRYWGDRLLIPLGLRVEPAIAEIDLLPTLGVDDQELGVFQSSGIEIIALSAFQPLTRAGVRLALGGST
jgi:hypothetical protein